MQTLGHIKKYLELVRFSHTVFALPFALAAMFLAAGGWPSWQLILLILAAMVTCRNAAMAFNRWLDAGIDAKNPRTQNRHIPAGLLSEKKVLSFFVINSLAFVLITWFINPLAFYLSLPTVGAVCFYSFTKRFTSWCHIFLGLAIGISPLGAWIAVTGKLAWAPLLLGLALMFWIAGFDIIYATQDHFFDKKAGLHSFVVKFGVNKSLVTAKVFHLIMLANLILLGTYLQLNFIYWMSILIAGTAIVYIHFFRRSASLDGLNRDFFLANAFISFIILGGVVASVFLGRI